MNQSLELLDYRRRVAEIYRHVRKSDPGPETWRAWRSQRDQLFADHPQSPIENRKTFRGLPYFDFDPKWRTEGRFVPDVEVETDVANSSHGSTRFRRVGVVEFEFDGQGHNLDVMWLDAYGGGTFVPFRDKTNGDSTYGGGRYLLDTVKGADLGQTATGLILDFNYAYHPSCVHSPKWSCPLAPPGNQLTLEVTAGEQISVNEEHGIQ